MNVEGYAQTLSPGGVNAARGLAGMFEDARLALTVPRLAFAGFDRLLERLALAQRTGMMPWRDVVGLLRRHPLFDAQRGCPFVDRAYRKPRGYAGDPWVIDFLLDEPEADAYLGPVAEWARVVGDAWRASSLGVAQRYRRAMLTAELQRMGTRRPGASVLCVGAGHLRELRCPEAVRAGLSFDHFVAVEQDELTVETLSRVAPFPVVPEERPWVSIARDGLADLGTFDLVYVPTLLEHVHDGLAAPLLRSLGRTMREGGRLVVGSLHPKLTSLPLMDALLDWRPIVRDRADLARLAEMATNERTRSVQTHTAPANDVAFLSMDY